MPDQDPITELRQLLITSHQQQLNISRSLLASQKAHTEAVEASLRLNSRMIMVMAVLLVIVAGLNLYALWPRDISAKRVIIIESPAPEEVVTGDQA